MSVHHHRGPTPLDHMPYTYPILPISAMFSYFPGIQQGKGSAVKDLTEKADAQNCGRKKKSQITTDKISSCLKHHLFFPIFLSPLIVLRTIMATKARLQQIFPITFYSSASVTLASSPSWKSVIPCFVNTQTSSWISSSRTPSPFGVLFRRHFSAHPKFQTVPHGTRSRLILD